MTTIQFTIRREPKDTSDEGVEYWVYEDILGVEERGNYIVIRTPNRSAFIPGWWVTEVNEIDEERS
jgi:hypothetical protein